MPTDVQTIANPGEVPLKVWLEPWVEHVEIPAHSVAEFRAWSDTPGRLEIEAGEVPTVYGWTGANLEVVVEGLSIWESYAPSPPVPKGMSMRGMVDLLFKGRK